jgi:pimeloyl-ACP methyl ester carboxylesterase
MKWVEACGELPRKFYLAGHSFGGYQAAQFASKYPERVSKVLFISPPNFVNFDPENYNPYVCRLDDNPNPPPRWLVNRAMRNTRRDRPLYASLDWIPGCILLWLLRRKCRQYF